MATKVKGLFKGLRNNISNIFDEKQEEDEIQIGFPTDVKHVAHIGMDGPSANTPTWMATLNSAPAAREAPELLVAPAPAVNPTETQQGNDTKGQASRSIKEIPRSRPSKDSNLDSPTRKGFDDLKHTRRHRHTNTEPPSDSSTRGSTRHTRRHRSSIQVGGSSSEETLEAGAATASKQHRRRKSKTANGDGSVKSSRRSKGHSMTDISLTDLESRNGAKRCESLV